MENDGVVGETLFDLGQDVEAQFRQNENALLIAGALFWLKLKCAVADADGDGQGIDAGFFHKFFPRDESRHR